MVAHCLTPPVNSREGMVSTDGRVSPAADRRGDAVNIARSPASRLVLNQARRVLQYGIDDPPGLFDGIFPCEQRRITGYRVTQDSLVGIHLLRAGVSARDDFRGQALGFGSGAQYIGAEG